MDQYNPIIDTPPDSWRGVKINTDFKVVLKFVQMLNNDKLTDYEKATITVGLFFQEVPEDQDDLWEFISYYIRCGREPEESKGKPVFDWEFDAGRILSAFLQTYKIDLRTFTCHWWTFVSLFDCLGEDTQLHKVMGYRSWKKSKHDSKEYIAEMRALQRRYRIPERAGQEIEAPSMAHLFKG